MFDTHCHLTDPRLLPQVDDVLARAAAVGVAKVVTVGTGLADSRASVDVCRGRAGVRCTVGIHPNHVPESSDGDVAPLAALLGEPGVVALGEIGLDYHYDGDRARQRRFFVEQLAIAQAAGVPVIVHCREAVDDALAVMADFRIARAVFHCFTGTEAEARRVVAAGHWLGFTGVITYKKSDEQRRAVLATPVERLLVETDAPYLSPEPHRGQKVNEPALVVHTARRVAELKGLGYDELDAVVTRNGEGFYGWES